MRSVRAAIAASLLAFWALCASGLPLGSGRALAATPGTPASHLQVLFAVDVSTSMRWNDPADLRALACRLFVDLLNSGDEAGLVTFGRGSQTVVAPAAVGTPVQQRRFTAGLNRLTILQPNTDILAALGAALHAYPGSAAGGVSRILILMTDGQPDPSQGNIANPTFRQKYDQEMYTDAAQLAADGWRVYTIGLGSTVDEQLLRELASEGDGAYFRAGTAEQLVPSYLSILAAVRGYTITDLGAAGTSGKTVTVGTGEATSRMVLVAARPGGGPVSLRVSSPSGAALPQGSTRQSGPGFAIVSISQPTPGRWTFAPEGGGTVRLFTAFSRAGQLQLVEPAEIAGLPVDQSMTLAVRVTGVSPGQAGSIHVQATVAGPGGSRTQVTLLDDGQGQDVAAGDSIYSGLLPALTAVGQYTLRLDLVQAGTVLATQQLPMFADLIPGVNLVAPDGYVPAGGSVPLHARIILGRRLLSSTDGAVIKSVTALLTGPGGSASVPMWDDGKPAHGDQRAGDRIYSALLDTAQLGPWLARVKVAGTFHNRPFTAVSPLARFAVVTPSHVAVTSVGLAGTALTTGSHFGVRVRVRSTATHPVSLVVAGTSAGPLRGDRQEISIPPHGDRVYTLAFRSVAGGRPGTYPLIVHLSLDEPDAALSVSQIRVAVAVLTPHQLFLRRVGPFMRVGRYVVPLVLFILLLALVGDLLRFRPATRVRGRLRAEPLANGSPLPDGATEVSLGKYHRREVWVGGPASADAQLRLPSLPTGQRAFRIYCEYERPRNWLLGSLQALVRRPEARLMVETVWPHHLYFDGLPATSGRLYHQDTFDIGNLRFVYLQAGEPVRPKKGTDLLAARHRGAESSPGEGPA